MSFLSGLKQVQNETVSILLTCLWKHHGDTVVQMCTNDDISFLIAGLNSSGSQNLVVDCKPAVKLATVVTEDFGVKRPTLENFFHQAMEIILNEAVKKANDVREKVSLFIN